MKKAVKITIVSIFCLILITVISAFLYLYSQTQPVSKNADSEEIRFEVEYGTSVYKISTMLKANGIIKNEKIFYYSLKSPKIISKICPKDSVPEKIEFKSGIYYLNPTMNYAQIINTLSSGRQEYIKVSIPEGLTITKIGELLEENEICNKIDFKNACYDSSIVNKYKIPGNSLEGYLFPDTYFFTSHMAVEQIIEMMINNFYSKIKEIEGLTDKSPEDLFYTVKLASIVEREYRIEDEAPIIASVFSNRLRRTIGLYSCATIEYILTEIEGRPHPDRILIEDTKIDSPYNTYKYAGLPPGPISNPGLVALNAAAHPAKTKYYFFQIVDPEEGRHVFTTTFDEHIESHSLYTKKR